MARYLPRSALLVVVVVFTLPIARHAQLVVPSSAVNAGFSPSSSPHMNMR